MSKIKTIKSIYKYLILFCIYFFCVFNTKVFALEDVTIQMNWNHQFAYAGYYAAIEKGFYEEEGLNVILKEQKAVKFPIDEVLNGEADYGIWVSSLILERLRGRPVVILANYYKNSALVILAKPEIRMAAQLRNKKIMGLPVDSRIAEIAYMLASDGLDYSDLIWIKHTFNPLDILTDKADAMTAYTTNQVYELNKNNAKFSILDPANYGVNFYGDSLFTSENKLKNNRAQAEALVRATNKGWEYAFEHTNEIIDLILKKYTSAKTRGALAFEAEKTKELFNPKVNEIGSIDRNRIERIADIFIDLGFAENKSNLEGIIFTKNTKNLKKIISNLNLTEQEIKFLKNNPVVHVSNKFDRPPFDFTVNGEAKGFSVDFMNLIFQRVGLTPDYQSGFAWYETMNKLKDNKIDIVHFLNKTADRTNDLLFSTPYYYSKKVVITKVNSPEISTIENLDRKIIAVPREWSLIEFFRKYYPHIYVVEVDSIREALEYVAMGKVFATIEQENIANYIIEKYGFTDLQSSKIIEDKYLSDFSSVHFAVSKNNPVLMSILKKGYETITPEDMQRLKRKWLGFEMHEIDYNEIGLLESEKEYIRKKELIRFSVAPLRMPLECSKEGRVIGMAADFIDLFSKKLDIDFKFIYADSWEDCLNMLINGEIDLIPMINKTTARNDYLLFTPGYINFRLGVIVKDSFPFISELKELNNFKVALVKNSQSFEIIKKDYPQIEVIECANQQEALLKVAKSEAAAAISTIPVASYIMQSFGLNNLKVGGILDFDDHVRVGVNKQDEVLASIMSKVVRSIAHKEVQNIYDKWIGVKFDPAFNYSLLLKIILVFVILISAFFVWNRKLMRLNQALLKANMEVEQKSRELERISITDSLTGLFNRRYFEKILHHEIKRVDRYKRDLCFLIIDIDHFKKVNDTFGHQVGDNVLKKVSDILKSNTRQSDIVARWGGEEFVVICPETDLKGGRILGEMLIEKVASSDFDVAGKQTISIGLSFYTSKDTEDALVARGDKALYLAKENGRNRLEIIL